MAPSDPRKYRDLAGNREIITVVDVSMTIVFTTGRRIYVEFNRVVDFGTYLPSVDFISVLYGEQRTKRRRHQRYCAYRFNSYTADKRLALVFGKGGGSPTRYTQPVLPVEIAGQWAVVSVLYPGQVERTAVSPPIPAPFPLHGTLH